MNTLKFLNKVPGGMLLCPLLIGAVIHTAAPHAGTYFGSFTGGFFTGLSPLLAVFFVCLGATLDLKGTPYILRKGGVLLGTKVAFALLVGAVAGHLLGEDTVSGGLLGGLSTLAIVAALNDTNGGIYVSLMGQYGNKRDAGAYSLMSVESGPFLTMVTLGVVGLSAFPWQALLGAIIPLILGFVLGNLDKNLRAFLAPLVPGLVPFLGLALGLTIDLRVVASAGLVGLVLGLFVVFVGGGVLLLADKLTGGNGVAGIAAATTAGNAAIVPAAVAEANPAYAHAAGTATVIVSASVVVTAILCPLATAFWARHVSRHESAQIMPTSDDSQSNEQSPETAHS
ncbi:2-keto-3-deoxygluconate permease [Streptomyces sp. NPDC000151]|uniref:2-keto-3-deoxygluconate permease n=1 Tax=Streptomyces sp. NPDC000151 TaxID=3154244 RepID=UPI003331658A